MRMLKYAIAAAVLAAAPAAVLAAETVVKVGHGTFEPAQVTIDAGDTVTFVNTKKMPGGHTIVFEEIEASSEGLVKGKSWSHTFDEPGTYSFHVKEHPDASGTVTVQ